MNANEIYSGKHLAAADLKGQRVTLQIAGVTLEELGQGDKKDQKIVLSFVGKEKRLVLNKTNNSMCIEIFDTADTDEWVGKHLVVYPTKTDYAGKRVDCIRIDKAVKPKAAKPAPEPVPDTSSDEFDASQIPF
jgi:hypothetical protein